MHEQRIQETFERRRAQLQTLRDEIRVKLHLAEMGAKKRWQKIEPEVDRAIFNLEAATERALDRTIDRMIRKLQKFNDSLSY